MSSLCMQRFADGSYRVHHRVAGPVRGSVNRRRSIWMDGPVFRRGDGVLHYMRLSVVHTDQYVIIRRHPVTGDEVFMGDAYHLSAVAAELALREMAETNGWVEEAGPE